MISDGSCCCALQSSAAAISSSYWACLNCEQTTFGEPGGDGEADTEPTEGGGELERSCDGSAEAAAGGSAWASNSNEQLGGGRSAGGERFAVPSWGSASANAGAGSFALTVFKASQYLDALSLRLRCL